jgi:hypothetical protein
MNARERFAPFAAALAAAGLFAGCAHSNPRAEEVAAAERARRDERLKIMREYWYDRTLAPAADNESAPPHPLTSYPAGTYSGVNYGPRLASDPGMTEPIRP